MGEKPELEGCRQLIGNYGEADCGQTLEQLKPYEGFSDLQAWLQLGEESEFARTCLSLVKQIRAMAESEKPYYYNIL